MQNPFLVRNIKDILDKKTPPSVDGGVAFQEITAGKYLQTQMQIRWKQWKPA